MSRRTWTAQDPEPDDHPDLADSNGEIWIWDEAVGQWWSPTLDAWTDWQGIFELHWSRRPERETASTVHELTPEESEELVREMFS